MAKQKYNAGDLVQLKAGGPKMVVEKVFAPLGYGNEISTGNVSYRCSWFSGAKHNREDFQEEALTPFKEEV